MFASYLSNVLTYLVAQNIHGPHFTTPNLSDLIFLIKFFSLIFRFNLKFKILAALNMRQKSSNKNYVVNLSCIVKILNIYIMLGAWQPCLKVSVQLWIFKCFKFQKSIMVVLKALLGDFYEEKRPQWDLLSQDRYKTPSCGTPQQPTIY